jgi:hypothetical protein
MENRDRITLRTLVLGVFCVYRKFLVFPNQIAYNGKIKKGDRIMRRNDREITDNKIIEEFIAKEHIIRVAFNDNGEIYIVPINYGYSCVNGNYSFYFHGAKEGRKYELSKCKPSVGFEIDGNYKVLENESACGFSAAFQSVIGTGILHLVEDEDEKRRGLNAIMKQTTQKSGWEYNEKMIEAVAVFKLEVDKISCKRNDGRR